MYSYAENILLVYQYLLVGLGLLFGGTPAFVAAVYLALIGVLNLAAVGIICIITTLIWDCVWYAVGMKVGQTRLTELVTKNAPPRSYEFLLKLFSMHPLKALFFSRFIYGLSSIVIIISGHLRVTFWKFLLVTELSILSWFLVLVFTGMLLNKTLESLEAAARNIYIIPPVLILIVLAGHYMGRKVFNFYIQKKHDR